MEDISLNSITVFNLDDTLSNGKINFSELVTVVSNTDLSGSSGKIVSMFDEVKNSVIKLNDSYVGMTDIVNNVKEKLVELFPDEFDLFTDLKDTSNDVYEFLLKEVERLCNIDNLLKFYDRNNPNYDADILKDLPDDKTVADLLGEIELPDGTVVDGDTYANLLQATILKNYSDRDASAMSILLPMALSADCGYRITYEHYGTGLYDTKDKDTRYSATIDVMLGGSDCNAVVSYGTAQGATVPFSWLDVEEFRDRDYNKYRIPYAEAQTADVLVSYNGTHVVMVIENNPENETMIIAESTGGGNMLTEWSYSEILSGRYHGGLGAYDMSRYYEL